MQAYETGIIGIRLLPQVIQEWRQPRLEQFSRARHTRSSIALPTFLAECAKPAFQAESALATMRLSKPLTPTTTIDGCRGDTQPECSFFR